MITKFSKTAMAVGLAISSTSAMSANSWLSRVNVIENNKPVVTQATQLNAVNSITRDSNQVVFDITVSLHNNPEGDEQKIYQEVFEYFADGVCEQSNGAHKLGKVSIFRENKHRSKSDIIWGEREWPRANASGFGANGMHIWFGDVFPNGAGAGKDYDMMADTKGAGFTLAHEWGHYVYGVFDEYRGRDITGHTSTPLTTDIATTSIMSNQWNARNNDYSWLNHSTTDNIGNVSRTAQGRVYGKSAWEVLVQNPKDDPKSGRKTAQPERTRFVTLAENSPDSVTPVKIELPEQQDNCRDQLNLVWVEGDIDMQVVIDRSGSMRYDPIENAKQAAKTLVDATSEGSTSMGIVSFSSSSSITQNHIITKIPDPDTGVKNSLKNAIDTITAYGSTALYDGTKLALDNLVSYQATQGTGAPGVVFVLADGEDNDSRISQSDVIINYQNANIPIFSFGYGSASPTGPLLTLANSTGGKYFSSPRSLAEITDAFLQANAIATDNQNLISSTTTIAGNDTWTSPIVVDSGLENINIFINYNGREDQIDLSLFDANGNSVNSVSFDCIAFSGNQSCQAVISSTDIANLGSGEWSLGVHNNNGLNGDIQAFVNVSAKPNLEGSYTVSVEGYNGNEVTYPAPMIITTALTKDKLITGANVVATITDPAANTSSLSMLDDGLAGDAVAGDGIYSAIAPYGMNGIYQIEVNVNNSGNTATYTSTGLLTPTLDGSQPEPEALPVIDENFVRIAKTSIVVSDVPYSDNNDQYYYATPIEPDNLGLDGVIDRAGDVDYFVINNIDVSKELVVRISDLTLGMEPKFTIYKQDGTTSIIEGVTLVSNPSATNYAYYKLSTAELESTLYVAVSHADDTATVGGYQLSTGEPLNTDVPPNIAPVATTDTASLWTGQSVTISPLLNDTDADGDTLTLESVDSSSAEGLISVQGNDISYDTVGKFANATPGSTVIDTFNYIVTDNRGAFVEGNVEVTVNINTHPSAEPDTMTVNENEAVVINAISNDSDADGHSISITSHSGSLSGSLVDNGDGTFTYDTNGQFDALIKGETAEESFDYVLTDQIGASSTGNVVVTVVGINTAPEASNDEGVTTKSASINIALLDNDTDLDGDTLQIASLETGSLKGVVTDNGDGTVTYNPNGQFATLYQGQSETESFSYTMTDGEAEATANVLITINGEGAAPQPEPQPEKKKSSGSLTWLLALFAPLAFRRRKQ